MPAFRTLRLSDAFEESDRYRPLGRAPTGNWNGMRNKGITIAVTGLLLLTGVAFADDVNVDHDIIPKELADTAVLLRERALLDNLSVDLVESITTEVGPRRVGTDGDKRAIAWAQAKFEELGFDRVWTEEVPIEYGWIRGEANAEIILWRPGW
jgi:hypothetical protein